MVFAGVPGPLRASAPPEEEFASEDNRQGQGNHDGQDAKHDENRIGTFSPLEFDDLLPDVAQVHCDWRV